MGLIASTIGALLLALCVLFASTAKTIEDLGLALVFGFLGLGVLAFGLAFAIVEEIKEAIKKAEEDNQPSCDCEEAVYELRQYIQPFFDYVYEGESQEEEDICFTADEADASSR